MARSPFCASATAPQKAHKRKTRNHTSPGKSRWFLFAFGLSSGSGLDEGCAGRFKVNFQDNAALGRNFKRNRDNLVRWGRHGSRGPAALQHAHYRAQDSSLHYQRRRATTDERRTHYQRVHFPNLAPFDARLMPSDSEFHNRRSRTQVSSEMLHPLWLRPFLLHSSHWMTLAQILNGCRRADSSR